MSSMIELAQRFKKQQSVYSRLPSMGQYYPTLHSPSREAVTLRFRGHDESQSFVNFASSNYLSINKRDEVKSAYLAAFDEFGSGANGSPVLSGYYAPHQKLEAALTRLHETEDTVLFSSGYCANLSLLAALLGEQDMLVFDEAIHGSIIDGGKLAHAKLRSFRHNDPDDLRQVLQRFRGQAELTIVATLGIFSMSGDIAPVPDLLRHSKEYGALFLLDEAHSVGVLGARGRGTLEHFGLAADSVDFCVGTLSKTLAGIGGYVTGKRDTTDFLRFAARAHVLSAAIPPTTAAGCAAAVNILEDEGAVLSARLRRNADVFRGRLREEGIRLLGDGTGVAAFSVPDFNKLWGATQFLFDRGVFLNPVLYPAVRNDEGRLRYYLNVAHTAEQLADAANATCEAVRKFGIDVDTPPTPKR